MNSPSEAVLLIIPLFALCPDRFNYQNPVGSLRDTRKLVLGMP
jgi:hypothetical protein